MAGNFKAIVNEFNSRYNVIDIARDYGFDLHKSGDSYRSPSIYDPGNNTTCTSYSVKKNLYYDFKTAQYGDALELLAVLGFNGNKGAALRSKGFNFDNAEYLKNMGKIQAEVKTFHENIRPADYEYLAERRISREYADKMLIGFNERDMPHGHEQRLIIPYFENGQIVYYVGRDRTGNITENNPKYRKAYIDGFNKNIIWGLHTLDRTDKPLVIAEGAFDAMSFDQEGFRVLSSITGTSNNDRWIISEYAKQEKNNIYICYDSDNAGGNFFKGMAEFLLSRKIFNFKKINLPPEFNGKNIKDISDYYTAGGSLDELIENATYGVNAYIDCFRPCDRETEAKSDKKRADFTKFAMNYGRYIGKSELVALFEKAEMRGYFSAAFLSSLLKDATRAPLDMDIVQEVTTERNIIYKSASGFYVYDELRGVWKLTDDGFIGGFIGKILGRFFNTAKKSNSVLDILKKETITEADFNTKPIMVFRNGTLEIETGKFRSHSPDDMATILLDYNYDISAKCPKWEQTLKEILCDPANPDTDVEGKNRIKLLREFCGYILYPNCPKQNLLFLHGEGSNGKGVIINTLEKVLGNKNISNVKIGDLGNHFEVVNLYGVLANFTTESPRAFTPDVTEQLKKAVAGENISASFKFRNSFKFKPRAKFIIAGNDLPVADDTSDGFFRRFKFIDFQNKFKSTANPEKRIFRKDEKLGEKLEAELSGIFNWVYEGYKRLKLQGDFTKTGDDDLLMGELRSINNPLADFITECFKGAAVAFYRKEIYSKYKDWCESTGNHIKPQNQVFWRYFRNELKRQNIDFKERRMTNGFIFKFDDFKNVIKEYSD